MLSCNTLWHSHGPSMQCRLYYKYTSKIHVQHISWTKISDKIDMQSVSQIRNIWGLLLIPHSIDTTNWIAVIGPKILIISMPNNLVTFNIFKFSTVKTKTHDPESLSTSNLHEFLTPFYRKLWNIEGLCLRLVHNLLWLVHVYSACCKLLPCKKYETCYM